MKRALVVGSITALSILSGFTACGKEPVACDGESLMPEAHACPDRASLGFGQEFNTGTLIGTSPINTIRVQNGGLKDLTITRAAVSGDSAFKVTTEPKDLPATIKGNKNFYMQVTFTPTEAKQYCGKITLESNAANADGGAQEFRLSGCGVPADGGASPCYGTGDAGVPPACP